MIYPFISAILPSLKPALPPEMSLEEFDALVKEELSGKLFDRMLSWENGQDALPLYAELRRFQDYLNFRIAQMRAEKLSRSASFAEPDEFYGEIDYALSAAVSATPLERERIVDAAVWRKLDDLETGHEMDFEYLCIYRIRLALLRKYSGRDENSGRENFEAALEKLAANLNEP